MKEGRGALENLTGKPIRERDRERKRERERERERDLGRTMLGWEDNIRIYSKKIGVSKRNWISPRIGIIGDPL